MIESEDDLFGGWPETSEAIGVDDVSESDESLFDGIPGLWGAVLIGILDDLSKPVWTAERKEAERMLKYPERTCLPVIALALGTPTSLLIDKIRNAGCRKDCRKIGKVLPGSGGGTTQ